MVLEIGLKLLNMSLIDRVSNVDRDGSIILIQILIKGNGQEISSGFYFYYTHVMVISGHKYQNTYQEEQIII